MKSGIYDASIVPKSTLETEYTKRIGPLEISIETSQALKRSQWIEVLPQVVAMEMERKDFASNIGM